MPFWRGSQSRGRSGLRCSRGVGGPAACRPQVVMHRSHAVDPVSWLLIACSDGSLLTTYSPVPSEPAGGDTRTSTPVRVRVL